MKAPWRYSLLAKMLGWLALHLIVLAAGFAIFVGLQLRVGLDSLLSGRTGERLRDLGEVVGGELRSSPRKEWPSILERHSKTRGVKLDLWQPPADWLANTYPQVPPNVVARLHDIRIPQGRPPARPQDAPPDRRGPSGRGFPPRPPRADEGLPPEEDDGPPPGQTDQGPPPVRDQPAPRDRDDRQMPIAHPVFLMRGTSGDGYWAAVEIPLAPRGVQSPVHALLIVRSDDLAGNGLFFEVRPWILGGFAVLAVSVAFWVPFAMGITRYVGRLTRATERIADGDFQVDMDTSRRDELGRLGSAVTELASRLDRFVSGQRRFLADVAHELCAPLARLRTGIAVLEPAVPETGQPRLNAIEEDADELARLIDEILAFSRAGAGRPQLRNCELEPLLQEVVSREGATLTLRLELVPGLSVQADPRLLSRAFGNLVRNTRIHAGSEASLVISATKTGDNVTISFRDNGPGVPTEELARLFEPFYRPDRSRTRDTGGSGLGLAIVSSCVEACGGRATASTPAAGGFEVIVTLPAADRTA